MVCTDGTEVTAGIVVSACNPHDTFLTWLNNPPPQAAALVTRWKSIPHDDGYESKIDAIVDREPRLAGGQALGSTTVISPSLAEIAPRVLDDGRWPDPRSTCHVRQRPIDPRPDASPRRVATCSASKCSTRRTRSPVAGATAREPRRWLDQVATALAPGFTDSLVDWRAMTPDRYEREFHLPHGHATSFAGGPLAALRNKNPELTRYETPVNGLYLTGAATFPGAGVWGASGRNAALRILAKVGERP